jgi:hypothetical protein
MRTGRQLKYPAGRLYGRLDPLGAGPQATSLPH